MLKFALLDALLDVVLLAYTIYITVRYRSLKHWKAGLKDPELWLSRSERHARARKLIQRKDDEYEQWLFEKNTDYIKKGGK